MKGVLNVSSPKEIMKNDAVALDDYSESYDDQKTLVITDCEGNEFIYRSLTRAIKKFKEISKKHGVVEMR
jgi:hypothetical protein